MIEIPQFVRQPRLLAVRADGDAVEDRGTPCETVSSGFCEVASVMSLMSFGGRLVVS